MQYGSKEVLEEVAGKSVYQLKEDFRQPFRERSLADQMRKKIVENVKMTPNEVREYYAQIPKDSLPFYESELEVSEIVVYPKANREVESYVTRELNEWKKQVEDGSKKFDQLAKSYTEDPGSKESGGQYNINRNDKIWDPAFLAAAFKLKEGQVSQVVKSKFGLHIIQMVSRSGDDAVIRHILRIPPVTDAEVKESITTLDSVRSKLTTGTMSFGEAVNRYSEDEGSKFSGGRRQGRDGSSFVTIDQLDKDMVLAIQKLKVGEYSQPIPFTDERGKKAVRLVYLQTRTEPHRENLTDDYSKVSQRALEEKKNGVLEKWFQSHIPNYFIVIDKEFSACENVKEWSSSAVANK
jgi:peptidyl-prolyl cis-trans isomerase SurA